MVSNFIHLLPKNTWILMLTNALSGIAHFIVLPYLSIYLHEYANLTTIQTGIIIGISPVLSTILSPFAGIIAKKIGYKSAIIIGSIGWVIASIIYANTYHFSLFCLAAIITGVSGSIQNIAFITTLSLSVSTKGSQSVLFNMNYWILNICAGLGPLIGIFFNSGKNPNLFYFIAVTELVFTLIILFIIKDSSRYHSQKNQEGKVDIFNSFLLFKQPGFALFVIGSFFCLLGYSQIESNFSLYLADYFEDGAFFYGKLISLNGFLAIILQPLSFYFSQKVGMKRALFLGPLFYSLSFLLFSSKTPIILYLSMIIFTFGETVYSPNSSAVVADLSDEASRSTYFGAFNLHGFGSFLGPPLGAFFLSQRHPYYLYLNYSYHPKS